MKAVLFVLAFVAFVAVVTASKANLEFYTKLVDEVNNKQSLWKAELSPQIVDGDYTTIKNLLGDLSVGATPQLPEKTDFKTSVGDLPESFMAAKHWPECANVMETVHDQSACGSCWAVSTAAAASERLCIKTKNDKIFLSSRDLLSCCSGCGFGCQGGWPSSAWSFIARDGLVTGHPDFTNTSLCVKYPFLSCKHHVEGEPQCSDYDFDTPSCQQSCDKESSWPIAYHNDKNRATRAYSVSGEVNIMKDLYENGPMTISYTVYQDFMAYKSGIYRHTSGSSLGGHAVTLEGWGVENGVKYWVLKNNWAMWGEKGYFRIVRGTNECNMESSANAGTFF